jgi:hypothetical protein
MFGVGSRTRFRWVVVILAIEFALLILEWRFGDQPGIIWGKEKCGGVVEATTATAGEDQ